MSVSNYNPRRISSGSRYDSDGNTISKATTGDIPLRLLRDLDQPFIYNVRTYKRHYRFEFYDTAAPDSYTLLNPDFVIICYAIDDRRSLVNAQQVWRKNAIRMYMRERDDIPVMLLGLKRDLRVEEDGVIYPQEVSGMDYLLVLFHFLFWSLIL